MMVRKIPYGLQKAGGFMLLETVLAVTIFAVGVLAIGSCMNNCLSAMASRKGDEVARLALQNRLSEIELGIVPLEEFKTEELLDMYAGITITQTKQPVDLYNEYGQLLSGMFEVTLQVDWTEGKQPQTKIVKFFTYRSGLYVQPPPLEDKDEKKRKQTPDE